MIGIEDLREKREEVQKQIRDEEAEKSKLQQDLQVLTKRLAHINDALARKVRDDVVFGAEQLTQYDPLLAELTCQQKVPFIQVVVAA